MVMNRTTSRPQSMLYLFSESFKKHPFKPSNIKIRPMRAEELFLTFTKRCNMRVESFNLTLGSQIFEACSDESRLRILHLIFENEEMCISDLEKILDFSQTKPSRHLTYLKNSGILTFRRHNHWVFYA